MSSNAISFYRQHHRSIAALEASRCFAKTSIQSNGPLPLSASHPILTELTRRIESFNLFSAIGVAEAEVRHSRFIAWLLAPEGKNGLGVAPLRALQCVMERAGGRPWPGTADEWRECKVQIEADGMDLVITHAGLRCVIVIENKIHADQQSDQLVRYRRRIEKQYPDWSQFYCYLTLRGDTPLDTAYAAVSYEEWLTELSPRARLEQERDPALAVMLRDYIELIQKGPDKIGELNVFGILHLARTELKHSHFIAWMLAPQAEHDWGTAFATYLLDLLIQRGLKLQTPMQELQLEDALVRREREHVDILFISERHRLVLAIENKIGAAESATQLAD